MDRYVDERDYGVLGSDRYTFFVLRRIIGGENRLLLTDHENLIICYSAPPYPVWVWTPDRASEEVYAKAYTRISDNGLLCNGQHFNVKKDLADYLIKRAAQDGINISLFMNMLAYDCPEPLKPEVKADGEIHLCTMEDLGELAAIMAQFADETGVDRKTKAEYRMDAEEYIASGKMYFWTNDSGKTVASCKYGPDGDLAAINLVYTYPEYRRRHYAENLVYRVTEIAKEAGYMPMLYTDADYVASNACYEMIGYVLRGELCTIAVTK